MAACSEEETEATHTQICIDKRTMERVFDELCPPSDDGADFFIWYYLLYRHIVPAVGKIVTGGTTVKPSNAVFTTAPAKGGLGTSRLASAGT